MPSDKSKVVIACAGSRKTTSIVEDALSLAGKRILITTYTNENLDQIHSYFVQRVGEVPSNIKLVSWYSFLLQEGVRPYQNHLTAADRARSIDYKSEAPMVKRADAARFYLTSEGDVYRDRVSDFVFHCDGKSGGLVVSRLERIYDFIFIDELQDFAGYDLNLVEKLFRSKLAIIAVGDPRQGTYSTNNAAKNKQFKKAGVLDWIAEKKGAGLFPVEERIHCYRSNQTICDFADALYPHLPKTISKNAHVTGHDGIFQVKRSDVLAYVEARRPIILRWNAKSDTMGLEAFNFGAMKGRTFDRVLIFPTKPMRAYLDTNDLSKAGDLSRFYVAVTRARFSVAFVVD